MAEQEPPRKRSLRHAHFALTEAEEVDEAVAEAEENEGDDDDEDDDNRDDNAEGDDESDEAECSTQQSGKRLRSSTTNLSSDVTPSPKLRSTRSVWETYIMI